MQKTAGHVFNAKEILLDITALRVIGIVFFLTLTVLGAFIYIPLGFTPVPVTLQTFFVLLGAAFLAKKDGALVQGLYAGLGLMGVPLFTLAQGGLLKLLGPTGGYIVGFIAASVLVSVVLEFFRAKTGLNFGIILMTMILGAAVIYLCGGLWLAFSLKLDLARVLALGVIPFLPGEALKIFGAAYIYHRCGQRTRRIFQK